MSEVFPLWEPREPPATRPVIPAPQGPGEVFPALSRSLAAEGHSPAFSCVKDDFSPDLV